MKQMIRISGLVVLAMLAACGTDENDPARPGSTNGVTVTGEVANIQNEIAVDGGITLDVDLVDDGTDRLIFVGLFTVPPPSDEDMRLYDLVRRVEIGDVVRAEGVRRDYGVILEKLWILDGSP